MKVRYGFVSNSSSSSCVIIGSLIDPERIDEYDNLVFVGKYLHEGQDIFSIDGNTRKAITELAKVFPNHFNMRGEKAGHESWLIMSGVVLDTEWSDRPVDKNILRGVVDSEDDAYIIPAHVDYYTTTDDQGVLDQYGRPIIETSEFSDMLDEHDTEDVITMLYKMVENDLGEFVLSLIRTGMGADDAVQVGLKRLEEKHARTE